ncbi:flavin mononucleotide-binding protein [Maribacter algicola]|uniref:Flavin mononucleotide-binding protein n=2 Tax=Maribacter algicola TaxID=2498892 RepID=A0A426RPI0_9FLAO|nr:flavin mononucleotide-binding protein [Maribacter algicola]
MRRNLEPAENLQILSSNYMGNLAYISGTSPFIVPMTYYYDRESHTITSYSSEGHKIAAMRKNNAVAFIVNQIETVADWQTVQVLGTFEELKGIDAKHMLHEFSEGIKNILSRTKGMDSEYISEFSAKIESDCSPIVFRININEITGKKRES